MIHFFEKNNISLHISDFKVICEVSSQRNFSIKLLSHKLLGKILLINDEIQHIEAWAPMYHENVVHIPISFIPRAKSALIIGGGSFFAAKEVLKYQSIKKLVMVDYDEIVIKTMTNNYLHAEEVLQDKRFSLVIEDIKLYLHKSEEKFDFIINDAIDLLELKDDYFSILNSKLTQSGVCSDLIYRHIFESEKCIKTIDLLRKNYNSAFSLITVPEYPGIMHVLSMWGKSDLIKQDATNIQNIVQKSWINTVKSNPCLVYDPRFIKYYLYLPPYLKMYIGNI